VRHDYLLRVTAVTEGGTGLALLAVPSLVLVVLLGVTDPAPEALVVARVLGGALVAIAVACWAARDHAPPLMLIAVLVYDVAAAAVLGVAGTNGGMAGIALLPAVVAHVGLAAWGVGVLLTAGARSARRPLSN